MQIRKSLLVLFVLACVSYVLLLAGCGGSPKNTLAATVAPLPPPPPPPSSSSSAPAPAPAPPPPGPPSNAIVTEKIEGMPGWQWCTAQLNHSVCAAGLGNATSSKTDHQATPSRDGSSSKFNIAGPKGYSNALWWKTLTPDPNVSHFNYDLWFYVDKPDASQALEFDTNQSFGGTRWVFGTECNFKDTGKWDLWDGKEGKWVPSSVPCTPFSGNTWHHLLWQFERVGSQVHYISVTVDGQTMPEDVYHDAQPDYGGNDIDVAFQLDGDSTQQPYNVWLDEVTLTTW